MNNSPAEIHGCLDMLGKVPHTSASLRAFSSASTARGVELLELIMVDAAGVPLMFEFATGDG